MFLHDKLNKLGILYGLVCDLWLWHFLVILTHLSGMNLPTLISRTSPFINLGLLVIIFLFKFRYRILYVFCFVLCYFVSILVLQSFWWGRESWLLCFVYLVSCHCCVALPRGAMGLSVVCDCGIS